MTNTMEYKGYIGKVEYDEVDGAFHGTVINLRDVIHFEGESVAELRQALRDSVEEYLAFCREAGEEPEKPYSGKFLVRTDPELHRKISISAGKKDVSLNEWVNQALERSVAEGL